MKEEYVDVRISRHAQRRIKERMGLSYKAMRRTAKKAFQYGLTPDNFKGAFRWYLKGKESKNKESGVIIKVHGNFIYYFASGNLITVIQIPKEYKYNKYKI